MSIFIDRISFVNYRQYGTFDINFSNDYGATLSVLIAKNGTGKTTLLNAISWCLYDEELHLSDKDSTLSILNRKVSQDNPVGTLIPVSVRICLHNEENSVEFLRETDALIQERDGVRSIASNKSQLTVSITPLQGHGNSRILRSPNADVEVKRFFDKDINHFYFFDGENLEDFFDPENAKNIKQSIFNISQVTLLETVHTHLAGLQKDLNKKLAETGSEQEKETHEQLISTKEKCDATEKNLHDAKNTRPFLAKKREKVEKQIRDFTPANDLIEKQRYLEENLKGLEAEIKTGLTVRRTFIRKYFILLSLFPRIQRTLDDIRSKEKNGKLPPSIDRTIVQKLLKNPEEPCPVCKRHLDEHCRKELEKLLLDLEISNKTSHFLVEIKGLLENFVDEVKGYKSQLNGFEAVKREWDQRKENLTKELQRTNQKLKEYPGANGVKFQELQNERADLNQKINILDEQIGLYTQTLEQQKKECEHLQKQWETLVEKTKGRKETRAQHKVVTQLIENFTRIQQNLENEIKKEIETDTWRNFGSLNWKEHTFNEIRIDENYNLSVFNSEGQKITGSLSAAEKMALAYAFTLAIHKASGKNCPLVIDSPLGRASDENRKRLAQILKDISKEKQVIMLVTPNEYSDEVSGLYKGHAEIREMGLTPDETKIEMGGYYG